MNFEEFLAAEKEKLEQDKNRILSSTFTKEIPKDLFLQQNQEQLQQQIEKDIDLNANLVVAGVEEPISTSAKSSSLATVPDDNVGATTETVLYFPASDASMSKESKNAVNEIHLLSGTQENGHEKEEIKSNSSSNNSRSSSGTRRKKKDDMEQWVSDTFYSYFPSINNETKKRQIHLQNKQLEYQQNYLKNIAENPPPKKHFTPRPAKTDIEIIVNNPTYGDNGKVRPGSTRHRLIQDLGHTNLSNIVNNDGIIERNKINAERELQNRRNYQHALLRQIEEKRHQIEMLKEKEKIEEDALTKRLEQQLKTMRLEEELEKEKLRIEKVKFETEQNKLKRQQLLAKLEKERKVLDSRETKSENDKESLVSQDNRVYKYFSNSARKEFSHRRRPSYVDDEREELALNIRKEVSDNSEPEEILKKKDKCVECISTSCPFCKIKLKNYDCWCIKCAREVTDFKGVENKSLVCDNCEKKYLICKTCDEGVDKCGNCQKRRNICLECLRNVCFHCGENPNDKRSSSRKNVSSERSFQILDMNYPTSEEDYESNKKSYRPPFSINIDKNSKFHPNYKEDNIGVENFDRLKLEANTKVKNFVKNYGDIMSPRTRPTEKDLFMPLLKEMPRKALTAKGEEILGEKTSNSDFDKKWEIPAVQRNYISKTSPKVITQLGAIRKQLQEEIFFDSNP